MCMSESEHGISVRKQLPNLGCSSPQVFEALINLGLIASAKQLMVDSVVWRYDKAIRVQIQLLLGDFADRCCLPYREVVVVAPPYP